MERMASWVMPKGGQLGEEDKYNSSSNMPLYHMNLKEIKIARDSAKDVT